MRLYLSRMEQTVLAVLLVAIIGALLALSYTYGRRQRAAEAAPFLEQAPVEGDAAAPLTTAPVEEIVVHVAGAVQHPGVYRFFPGARVDDAVRQAGGAREDGYADGLNLAAHLEDGERICVPTKVEWARLTAERGPSPLVVAGTPDPLSTRPASTTVTSKPDPKTTGAPEHETAGPKPLPAKKVNLNTATLDDLMTLPNIGPVSAGRILDYRKAQGKFTDQAQLLNVPGIGPKTYEKVAPYIVL